jgi:hypothetical protein
MWHVTHNTLLKPMPAACMEMMGDLEEAEPLYEESLRIKQVSCCIDL